MNRKTIARRLKPNQILYSNLYIYIFKTPHIRLIVLIFYVLNMLNKNKYHKIKKTREFNYISCVRYSIQIWSFGSVEWLYMRMHSTST